MIGKFELDIISKSPVKDFVEFENYIKIANELLLIDYKYFAEFFKINIIKELDNPQGCYIIIINHILYLFFFNKNKLKEQLKKVWVKMKLVVKAKDYTTQPVVELVGKYKKGKEEGVYKTVKSFKEVLDENYISTTNFKYILQVLAGLKRAINEKIG